MSKKLWILRCFAVVRCENRDTEYVDFILFLYVIKLVTPDFHLNKKR